MQRPKAIALFTVLSLAYLAYSASIYIQPGLHNSTGIFNVDLAAEGRMVFQKYNCQACHQLFGLGGYLVPDLTNVYGDPHKGEAAIRSIVNYGNKQMPSFNFTEQEMHALLEFLKSTDAAGTSDPRKLTIQSDGMITAE